MINLNALDVPPAPDGPDPTFFWSFLGDGVLSNSIYTCFFR